MTASSVKTALSWTLPEATPLAAELASVLAPLVGPVHVLPTKPKSVVMRLETSEGPRVAKWAVRTHLRNERWAYQTLLPEIGLRGPVFRSWLECDDRAWLVVDAVEGRQPCLHESAADQAKVARWGADLHHRSRVAGLVPPAPVPRPSPESRLRALAEALEGCPDAPPEAIEACLKIERRFQLIVEAAAAVEPCITHGDLYDWNLLLGADVVALDWERVSYGSPAADLHLVDLDAYTARLRTYGEQPDRVTLSRAQAAGTVLYCLTHDLARKPFKRQLAYLRRMTHSFNDLECSRERGHG